MEELDLVTALSKASELKILCIGDLMLDRFVYGSVGRISPEAPVPVLKRTRITEMLGGAGNVARNLASLGAHVLLIGVIGDDQEGALVKRRVDELSNVSGTFILADDRTTTSKTRFIAGGQQLLRVDEEESAAVSAQTEASLISEIEKTASQADIIILSDYAKGVVTDALITAVLKLAEDKGIQIIVDPKGDDFKRYGAVDIIKPNANELAALTGLPVQSDTEIENALDAAFTMTKAGAIIVTRAAKGMSVKVRGGDVQHFKGEAKDVYDVSGAGDTSIATLAAMIGAGASLEAATKTAIAASGIAVGKSGTATVTRKEVESVLQSGTINANTNFLTLEAMIQKADAWRDEGLDIGFTNGCFDILHPGHLSVLEAAKSRCDRLIVGLNSDASVKRLKGESRPINGAAARAQVLNALSIVDAVVIFEEDTPTELISELAPDLLVKGGDYTIETIVGANEVIRNGGKVHIVPIVEGHSTTAAIERAKQPS